MEIRVRIYTYIVIIIGHTYRIILLGMWACRDRSEYQAAHNLATQLGR